MTSETLRAKREILLVAIALILGSIFIIFPFLDAIILAVVTAYLLSMLHENLTHYIKSELLSTVVIISGLLATISGGIYLFFSNIFEIIQRLNVFTDSMEELFLSTIEPLNLPPYISSNISDFFSQASSFTTDFLLGLFTSMPYFLIQTGIFLVASIYIYKDRKRIYTTFDELIDDLPETESRIIRSIVESIDQIFRGVFLTQMTVAGIMAVLAAAGFYLIGSLTTPIPLVPLWALLIGVFAIIPIIAAFMVYTPLALYYLVAAEPLKGSMIFLYGVIVLQILPEILFRPWVGSRNLNEHPLIIFIGFIAGPLVFGVKGIIIGPLMLILTKQFILNYADLVSGQD